MNHVLLLLVLLAAGWLRLIGVNWDQGTHLHPDERFLTMVAADIHRPDSITAYFDTARSPMNPANVGRPFFVYGTLPLFLTRAVAETAGLTGYDQIHLVGRVLSALFDLGTVALTFWLGLLVAGPRVAAAASALVAFSVVSVQQAHFFTVDSAATCLTTLALVMLARVVIRGGYSSHVLFGVAFGLTLSCRLNLALLGALYAVALLYLWYSGRVRVAAVAAAACLAGTFTLVVFRLFQPYAFAGPGFFDLRLAQDFLQSTSTIRDLVTGAVDYPPSVQWIGRIPVVSAGANLILWGIGPAWGILAIVGLAWCMRPRQAREGENIAAGRIVLLWAPVLFLFHATQFAATLRYFLPIIPALAIAAAWVLGRPGASRGRTWLLVVVIGLTAAWCVAFSSIYQRPHTRVAASEWIYDNLAPGTIIAVEHWDDALPLGIDQRSASAYKRIELKLYDEENDGKRTQLIDTLDAASVIVLSSNRLYAAIPRAPWRYPLARRYYELLFSNQLGFQLEKVFTSYPAIGSLEVNDDHAEEAFTVYDHPKVLIFRKTDAYSRERLKTLLGDVSFAGVVRVPPREASALYRRVRPSDVQLDVDATVRHPVAIPSMGSLTALARWLIGLEVLSLASFALLFRPLAAGRDRGYGLAKLVAWAGCGTMMWLLASTGVASHTPGMLRGIAACITVAGAAAAWRDRLNLAGFCRANRRLLLSVEATFLLTFVLFLTVRSLNPAIFWGEKPMDFAILNASLRAAAMPPADPWFAGETLNYFYFGHALTAFFAGLTGVPAAFAFNLAIATVGGLLATAAFLVGYQLSARVLVGLLASGAVVLVGNLAGVRLWLGNPSLSVNFDYFWATSRVIHGTINEFPFWSFVFADLHAHVLAMPFEAALLYLGSLWIAPSPAGRPRWLVVGAITAWFGGTVAVTSSWSIPTVVAMQFGLLATAWIQRGATWRDLVRFSLLAVAMLLLARVLFLPFWSHYSPPPRQWGFIRQEFAPIVDVLTIFGGFLVASLPPLVHAVREWSRGRLLPTLGIVAALAACAGTGWLRSPACALFLGWAFLAIVAWASTANGTVRTGALLIAVAGAVGATTEVVFVWDRMNTVFKYYLQMWLLLGCGSAVLVWSATQHASRRWTTVVPVAAVGIAGIFTSVTGVVGFVKSPHAVSRTPTLDGMAYLESANPSELAAYQWVNREVEGIPVMLEAHGASYQAFSRVSMNTGLPTVLGWQYHLFQQGRAREEIDARARHVREIYTSSDAARVEALLQNYRVDFIFVGPLEQQTYGSGIVERFANSPWVEPVFKSGTVTIFAAPGRLSTIKTWIEKAPPLPPSSIDPLAPLNEPRGLAVAPDGTIVVADFGNRRIQRLGRDAAPLSAFGVAGEGPAQFRDPCGIAVGADGTIWVADTWNHRVQALTPEGRQLTEWRAGLYGPRGIALAANGVVYVTDTGNKRVLRFAPDGTYSVIADQTVLDNPVGIATDRYGDIYVADVGHRRMVVLSPAGQVLREWSIDGWQPGSRMEPYLAVGPDDVVWVTDPPNGRVLLFTRNGASVGTATPASPLTLPLGIAIVDRVTAVVTDAATNAVITVTRPGAGR